MTLSNDELARERQRGYTASAGRYLMRCREHCETEHGATILDYRQRVKEWHSENHPGCTTWPTPTADGATTEEGNT